MKKTRYTEEQIAFALKQAPVAEVIRRMGMGELRRVKRLEDENRKLKQLVANLSLDKHILQDVLSKNVWSAPAWQA